MDTQPAPPRQDDDDHDDEEALDAVSSFDSDTSDENFPLRTRRPPRKQGWLQHYIDWARAINNFVLDRFFELSMMQRLLALVAAFILAILGILALIFHRPILVKMDQWARRWHDVKGGWVLLWVAAVITAFPPIVGYSYCLTTTGFIYGFPNGWFIAATATVFGSACSFIVCRRYLAERIRRATKRSGQFDIFERVVHDRDVKLLCLIRLCPLPFSFSNGGLATLTKVSLRNFVFATTITTPKLFTHIFIGSQIAAIGDSKKPSSESRAVHYLAIFFTILVSAFTARYVYNKARQVASSLETPAAELDEEIESQPLPRFSDHGADINKPDSEAQQEDRQGSTPEQT